MSKVLQITWRAKEISFCKKTSVAGFPPEKTASASGVRERSIESTQSIETNEAHFNSKRL